jgi:hypothetical protein
MSLLDSVSLLARHQILARWNLLPLLFSIRLISENTFARKTHSFKKENERPSISIKKYIENEIRSTTSHDSALDVRERFISFGGIVPVKTTETSWQLSTIAFYFIANCPLFEIYNYSRHDL